MLDTLDVARLSGPDISPASPAGVSSLYVVGGRQRSLRPVRAHFGDWYEYESGVLLRIDTMTGVARRVVEYQTPAAECPPEDPAVLFKSGTLAQGHLYLTTQTEVLIYRVPSFELVRRISLPAFNDVHHVRPTPHGTLLVAVTGLDMVMEVTIGGDVVREWNLWQPGTPVWGDRFSTDVDYRLIPSTKPHLAHPNHVFHIGDEPWATRFQQQDAVSLLDPTRRIHIGLERIHDGIVVGDQVLFTTVDAKVVIADTRSLTVVQVIDLREMHDEDLLLGWCRGLLLDGDRLWVGFSRMRPTRFRENVAFLKNGFRHYLGTHVACYDLGERRCVAQIDTEAAGLNAVFGVYRAG